MSTDSFRDFVLEQLAAIPSFSCKRMFGGYGLYGGGKFFGIIYKGRLYFRVTPDTLPDYMAYHADMFVPSEKQILKNYREVPVDILEDSSRLVSWAKKAAG
jgi:DNA transformation protein